jgi:hypothetical protein
MIATPSGVPDAGSMARARASSFFASRQAVSSPPSDLFIDFARQSNDVLPGSGNRREDHPDSRAAGFDLST